jgi:guanylate kinase
MPEGVNRPDMPPIAGGRMAEGVNRADMPPRRGLCLVLCAASGAGKSSVSRALLESEPELALSISATTRAPRPGEREGVHYFFRSVEQFQGMVAAGAMLEHAEVFGRFYGTPRAPVETALAEGRDVLFDIDWQGHLQLREALPGDVLCIHLLPPSLSELERRLAKRGQDNAEEIARRMAAARTEIAHWTDADHVLVNRDFAATVASVRAILHAGRTARARLPGMAGFVDGLMAG